MGFDVLYLPPIHPIGRRNRKGRNNALSAQPGDPGSPYAIGAASGGHEAVHPQLGGIEAFRRLLRPPPTHGIEVAFDFAVHSSRRPSLAQRTSGLVRLARRRHRSATRRIRRRNTRTSSTSISTAKDARAGAVAGAARRGAGLGGRGRQDLPGGQPAYQAAAVLGVADRRHPRARSRRDLPRRGVHAPGDDVPAGQDRLFAKLHLLHLAQQQGGADRVLHRAHHPGAEAISSGRTCSSIPRISIRSSCKPRDGPDS